MKSEGFYFGSGCRAAGSDRVGFNPNRIATNLRKGLNLICGDSKGFGLRLMKE